MTRFSLFPRSSIRTALLAGLGAVFGLWLLSGYELLASVSDVEDRVDHLHASFVRGEETLSTVRTNVLLGSIYLRDALVDTGSVTRQFYRDELHQVRAEIESALPVYMREVSLPIERAEWNALQRSLTEYWDTLDLVIGPDAPRTFSEGSGLLRRKVVPARDNVLQIVERLTALQRLSQNRQQLEAAVLYDEVRTQFLLVSGATIVLAVLVAAFAFIRVGGMEREIHDRRLAEVENRHDLERLSARLVDAQEDERRHLARELHDEVGQALTAIKMEIGVALRSAADARARGSLEEARGIVERTLQSVRDLSQLLHPSMLDDFGLPETLQAYVRSFSKRSGIRTEFIVAGLDRRLPDEVEVCVYRIVQEALHNVARHSGAAGCTVTLNCGEGALRLTIDDDGTGMNAVDTADRRGLGLIGMRERAQALSGRFTIGNAPAGGARVVVTIPLPLAATAAAARQRLAV
jgi:signal transduction histidine kinase